MTSGPRDVPGTDENSPAVYHIELRQFPHNLLRFNLAEGELRATIVEPWAREQWIELGDRKWNPHQAKLTVLEGPHLPVEELSLGRGWRAARRQGRDVTERLLAAAREAMGVEMHKPITPAREARPSAAAEGLLADSLGLELLTLLGAGPAPPRRAWELAQMRHPERTASQCLALAERAVASLLRSRLVVLTWADRPDAARSQLGEEEEVQALLHALDSWTGESVGLARR
jgi:hypothetical protein